MLTFSGMGSSSGTQSSHRASKHMIQRGRFCREHENSLFRSNLIAKRFSPDFNRRLYWLINDTKGIE